MQPLDDPKDEKESCEQSLIYCWCKRSQEENIFVDTQLVNICALVGNGWSPNMPRSLRRYSKTAPEDAWQHPGIRMYCGVLQSLKLALTSTEPLTV